MSMDVDNRLSQARAAWARLFRNSSKIQHNTNECQTQQTTQGTIVLSQENLKENIFWGDELKEKAPTNTRIYIQNVNGIILQKDGGQFTELCNIVKETQADILCIQEHNLDTTQYIVQNTLHTTSRRHWERSRLTIASSPIQFQNTWKPGGTSILSVGSLTGRIKTHGSDPWGRWCYQIFQGSGGRRITIVSAYQVVANHSHNKGQYTAAAQQQSLLLRQSDKLQDPRQAFRRDITEFLHTQIQTGHLILLVGDFNERLGDDISGISRIAAQFEFVDIMSHHHQHLNDPATYARGRKRLDYILASPQLASAVQKCGYEPFNFRFHTDHRAYYVDLDTETLFRSSTQKLAAYPTRILHSNNVKQVTKYIKEKHALLTNCNAFNRAKQLTLPGNRHNFAERLDADVTRMSLVAETRVHRYKLPDWSAELDDARKRVSVLSKILSMAKTNINNLEVVSRELMELNKPLLMPETQQECSTELRRAKREVADIIKQSYTTRVTERDRIIAQLEADLFNPQNKAKIRILKQLKKAEAIKKMFQKLQVLRNTNSKSGITRLEIPVDANDDPKTCTRWRVIDMPTEILAHLQHRNRKHFGQAHGSPFTQPPLMEDLGFLGDTEHAELILSGDYDVSQLDKAVQLLVQHLKQTQYASQHPIKPSITQSEFIGKIKKWRESTSTSPSGLHLGHYKAMSARHEYSDLKENDPQRVEFENMVSDIVELHLQLVNYALERGFTYNRWCQVANTMIFKEPGNIKIHRTRVIHIYEADYNLAMGLKWRAALFLSEDKKALNPGQYGSRPSRGAHDPVFIEEMQLEISRLTRKSVVQINYDATACYDRIIPNLAALVARKYGVPTPAVLTNASTLQRVKYRLKTDLGLSESYYSHAPQEWPIYGTGQGSGNSPAIWCFLSSTLFDAYETRAIGATYERPDRSSTTRIHMIGYVDDSNGQTNDFCSDKQPEHQCLLDMAQSDAQLWRDLLSASGGALELQKCAFHAVTWTFMADGSPFGQGIIESAGITINQGDDSTACKLKELSVHTAHKTLGHYKDPVGNQKRQYDALLEKSNRAAEFIARSPLDREEAWTYYFAIYLPSLGFPLSNCHFTRKQLENIQRKFMANIFAKCGFNRHTKREILFGPAHLGGANFRSLYTVQGEGQVTAFIKYWRSPSQAGQLLRIAHAWAQYAAGTSTPILEDTNTPLPHLEAKWLASLRQFLSTVGGTIEVDDPQVPIKERAHDWHIMDAILQSGQFSDQEIRQLNYCRLYLQAVTLSDITNARGTCLDLFMLQGRRHTTMSLTKWHLVNQQRPPARAWTLWRRANGLWSHPDGTLKQPLGAWQFSPQHLRRHWPAYYSEATETVYYRQSTSTIRYVGYSARQCQRQAQRIFLNSYDQMCASLPDDAIPVDTYDDEFGRHCVMVCSSAIKIARKLQNLNRQHNRPVIDTFHSFLMSLDPWESDLLRQVQFKYDVYTTVTMLSTGFIAASDGSVVHQRQGAYGWIVATPRGDRVIWAAGPARGRRITSYRAEGYGILSVLRLITRLFEYCQQTGTVEWHVTCDNSSMVDQIATIPQPQLDNQTKCEVYDWTHWQEVTRGEVDERDPALIASISTTANPTLEADWDLINEIRWNLKEQQQLQGCTVKHIKGHQDQSKTYSDLSLDAQLNVDADRLAREYQDTMDMPEAVVYLFPHASVQLHLRDGTVTSQMSRALRSALTEQELTKYIQTRLGWSDRVMQSVDWDAHHLAIKRHNKKRIQITKLIYELVPTNKVVYRNQPGQQHWLPPLQQSHYRRS